MIFKSRLVPLTDSTVERLAAYQECRSWYFPALGASGPLFVNRRGHRCARTTVKTTFRKMAQQVGVKSSQGRTPRLHDFRHTFATRCLNSLYNAGKDPAIGLPILATYLGHTKITHTAIYLHPSVDLLAVAGERFHSYAGGLNDGSGGQP
jgi:integrase/recombinase XerD